MNRCDRKRFSRWLVLSVGLVATAGLGAACEATSPASSRIRRDVALLADHDGNISNEAGDRLRKDGAAAVPALAAALERQDGTYLQKWEIILCLRSMRSLQAVPALVRFSDREGWFLVADEAASFPHDEGYWDRPPSPSGRKYLALFARETIGVIIDRTGEWGGVKGAFTTEKPGTEGFYRVLEKRKAYWRKVNSWYQDWREGFDPRQWSERLKKADR